MTLASYPTSDLVGLPAVPQVFNLVRHQYQLQQQRTLTTSLAPDPQAQALVASAAAMSSVGLLLQVIEPLVDRTPCDHPTAFNERLALVLSALDGFLRAATPPDVCVPTISNQVQRQCLLPSALTTAAVQATLVLVLAALTDDALQIVVTMPRATEGGIQIEVETDTAGIASPALQADRDRVEDALHVVHGVLTVEPRAASCIARLWLPEPTIEPI